MRFSLPLFSISLSLCGPAPAAPAPQVPSGAENALGGGEETRFLEGSGLKNPSLGTRKMATPFAARVVAQDLPLDALTPRGKAPYLPPPQTQSGLTLHVIDAGWTSLAQWWPLQHSDSRPLFYLSVLAPGVSDRLVNSSSFSFEGPNGEPVTLYSAEPLALIGGPRGVWRGVFKGVNPAWKHLVVYFETLAPDAPPNASGQFDSTVSFENVPLPSEGSKFLKVNKEATTLRGTQIVLQSVQVQRTHQETTFDFAVKPPVGVPDMEVSLAIAGIKNQAGEPWQSAHSGGTITQLQVQNVPRRSDTAMTLSLKVRESAPSLQKRHWYRRFRVEVPVAAMLKIAPPPANPSALVLKAQGQNVAVEIEPDDTQSSESWNALAWIRERSPVTGKTQRWLVRDLLAHTEDGGTRGWALENRYDREFMRLNGAVAAPNEHSVPITLPFETRPKNFEFEITLEKARRLESVRELHDVIVPAPGTSLDIREGELERENVRVRRVFRFENASELAGTSPDARASLQNVNLAIVVEILPTISGATTDILAYRIQDGAGRSLNARLWRGDVTRAVTKNFHLQTLILPVSTSSKSLNIWLNTVETAWSGQRETLFFRNLTGNETGKR